jgi:uncharacterized glyoxalase superfamily protein PhnB
LDARGSDGQGSEAHSGGLPHDHTQLTLDNAAQTIDWYKRALGAEEVGRSVGPDGKIMHAEIKIGDSRIMVNDVMQGSKGPNGFGGSPASLWLGRSRRLPRRSERLYVVDS